MSYTDVLKKSKNAVIVCHSVLFCLELGAQSIDVIWAVFAQDLGLDSKAIGWIGFGFYIAVGLGDIIFGTLADKIGFPAVVSICLILFALCCLFQGILSSINIIALVSVISGFANSAAVLKLGFTTFLLPHKYVVKFQVIAAVCSVFASCIGPLITAIIILITGDYKFIFYFYTLLLGLLSIVSLYNIKNESRIVKLQQIHRYRVPSVENINDEIDNENDNDNNQNDEQTNNMNQNRNFQVCANEETAFPLNLYKEDKINENMNKKWYSINFPGLTYWEYLHLFWLISFSFFNWGVVQIFSNWYVFYAKHRYNANVSISSFQIAVSIIFVSLGVITSTKINKYVPRICCVNKNDKFLKQIEKNAQLILLWTTFVAVFVSYSCIYVENSYTMWILVPCCTFLLGMVHQCLIVLYLAIQPPKNAGFILGLKYISRNFGAACCNLFVGYLLQFDLIWFWISFTICIGCEFLIVCAMYLSNWIRRQKEKDK